MCERELRSLRARTASQHTTDSLDLIGTTTTRLLPHSHVSAPRRIRSAAARGTARPLWCSMAGFVVPYTEQQTPLGRISVGLRAKVARWTPVDAKGLWMGVLRQIDIMLSVATRHATYGCSDVEGGKRDNTIGSNAL